MCIVVFVVVDDDVCCGVRVCCCVVECCIFVCDCLVGEGVVYVLIRLIGGILFVFIFDCLFDVVGV